MAPTFQIYKDQSIKQTTTSITVGHSRQVIQQQNLPPKPQDDERATGIRNPQVVRHIQPQNNARSRSDDLEPNQRYYFDKRKLFPVSGVEYCFEEINLVSWLRRQKQLAEKHKYDELTQENEELKQKLGDLNCQITLLLNAQKQMQQQLLHQQQQLQQQQQQLQLQEQQLQLQEQQHQENQHENQEENQQGPPSPTLTHNRLSIVPQSLKPSQGLETDVSHYGAITEAPSVVQDLWHTITQDKFTVPIDQSQYIKENVPTSTPTHNNRQQNKFQNRRMSRPSVGGSPTLKLSPITETSRDCNSKSSSTSSGLSDTPGTAKKIEQPMLKPPVPNDEPEQPLDPHDPSTYSCLLRGLTDSIESRSGYYKLNRSIPKIRQGACFEAGADRYLVDKELCQNPRIFTAQLLTDESNDSSDMPIKTICFRVDQPANNWLYYICNELHRRLVKQKTKPDIELSVMMANPVVMYSDGSILVDEYFRFVTMQDFVDACRELNKPFPKSVAAYITLELIQLVRQMHSCDIIHMNINTRNILITCCPTRDDVARVGERTSIVKLIGFENAMDTRLVSERAQQLDYEMIETKPWTYEVDWLGTLSCIYKMFFLEDLVFEDDETGSKSVDEQKFKGFPTNVWYPMFEELLNVGNDFSAATSVVEKSVEELNTWIKANVSFVLKEADFLDRILEEYCRANNKSVRT